MDNTDEKPTITPQDAPKEEEATPANSHIDNSEAVEEEIEAETKEDTTDTASTPEDSEPIVEQDPEMLFDQWIQVKKKLHFGGRTPRIRQGEVWWCSFGENVGIEINGKGSRFTRPVLIMTKLSHLGFMGIPLTTQPKSGSWYVPFVLKDATEYAAICQAKVLSVSRLHRKMCEVPENDLATVKEAFHKLYK